MATIINPTQDPNAYTAIQELVGNLNATAAQIDASPLFRAAENAIVAVLPAATDRSYANRATVVSALEFLAAYNFISGGGTVANSQDTTTSEQLRSITEETRSISQRKEFVVGSSGVSIEENAENRATFFKDQADTLLAQLGVSLDDDDTDGDGFTFVTVTKTNRS